MEKSILRKQARIIRDEQDIEELKKKSKIILGKLYDLSSTLTAIGPFTLYPKEDGITFEPIEISRVPLLLSEKFKRSGDNFSFCPVLLVASR